MKHYIITSVLSGATTHETLLKNMELLAKKLGECEILALPVGKGDDWDLHSDLVVTERAEYNGFTLMGDIRVRPTTLNPLAGILNTTRSTKSQIFGATQIACKSLSRAFSDKQFRGAFTTGTVSRLEDCTYPNTNPGIKAKFNHSLGFTLVSTHGEHTWIHPIYANHEGSFCYDGLKIEHGLVSKAWYKGCVLGDTHFPKQHKSLVKQAMDLCDGLEIDTLVVNDLLNITTDSHHAQSTGTRMRQEWYSLEDELSEAKEAVRQMAEGRYLVNLRSNHNEHGDKWLDRTDVRSLNPLDLDLWFSYNHQRSVTGDCFVDIWLKETLGDSHWWSADDKEPFKLGGFDCIHGDKGVSGARGGITQFSQYSRKVIFGHTHCFEILHGATNVPALCEHDQGYNNSLTKWASGVVLVDQFDKRHLVVASQDILTPWS
jgi:hypothetical protein